ncbi:MAG TPA: leucine-rich repeat domain-containing protein [Bacteroidia bacterium]|jgi:leucine-rich repeat protein SHOC2
MGGREKVTGSFIGLVLLLLFALKSNAQLLDSAALSQEPVFDNLQEALKDPDKVYRLHLIKMKLTHIPPEVYQFKNLQELDLSKNRIKELPDSIALLTNLQILSFSKNELEILPAAIGKLVNLRKLVVNQNSLTALPPALGDLENLRVLDLWSNDISFWPDQLANLKKLRHMDVRSILIPDDEIKKLQELLPNTEINFDPSCHCSGG